MNISFTGHNIELTESLKVFAEEKFNKLTKHFDRITSIHIVFTVEKERHIVEANVALAKTQLHGSVESTDMYTAIDLLIDKINRQLIKHKEKIKNHRP